MQSFIVCFLQAAVIQEGIEDTTVGILTIKYSDLSEVEDIGIVLEGHAVLQDLPSVAIAFFFLLFLVDIQGILFIDLLVTMYNIHTI